MDKHYSKAVFVFNDHGRFLYRLFRVGKGPGEYTDIFDMDVDLNYIYLLDSGWKILKYDRITGATVDEYSFDHWKGREFAVINNGQSVFYNKGFKETDYFSFNVPHCQIYETNFFGSYSKCVYRHNPRLASTYTHPVLSFSRHRDEVYAMPGYEYNFYNLTDLGLQEEVHFNFGKYNLDLERVEAVYKTPRKEILNDYFYVEPVVGLLSQFCFTSDYLSIVYGYHGWKYNLLFDRINKRVVMDGMNILSSFKYGFTVPMPIAAQGKYFYSVIPYNELDLSVLRSSNQSNSIPAKESNTQSIDERNPVLIKFKFKDPNHAIWNDYERMKAFLRDQQGTQISTE